MIKGLRNQNGVLKKLSDKNQKDLETANTDLDNICDLIFSSKIT